MADNKIFCGSGKKQEFNNGGSITRVMLDLDALNSNFKEYGFTTDNGKKMIKVNVSTLKNGTDQYGKTHSVEIDTFKPDPNFNNQGGGNNNYQQQNDNNKPSYNEDDRPF